jgi:MFS family permease
VSEPRGDAHAWLSIAILLLMTVLSHIDRSVIGLMIDPIKADLLISDVQISLLQGFAFALFYACFSVPMGWLADRYSRRGVIYLGVTSWSIATVACGLARTYGQLFAARFGVGIGEATLSPAAYGLVADLFPKRQLALAVGVLAAGAAVGSAVAIIAGGFIVQWAQETGGFWNLAPWQVVFVVVGAPGLVIAPLVFLIPRTRHLRRIASASLAGLGYGRWLWRNADYLVPTFLGVGLHAVLAYGMGAWTPAYFSRHFGLDVATIGLTLGLVGGITGVIGFIGGGWLVDRLHAAGVPDAHFRYFIVNCTLIIVLGVLAFAVIDSVVVLIVLLGILHLLLPFTGPAVAHLQSSTPQHFRGRTIALFMLTMNLLGMTLGPSSVALFSEHVFGGPEHIGSGIALLIAIGGPAALLMFVLARRPARRALAEGLAGGADDPVRRRGARDVSDGHGPANVSAQA